QGANDPACAVINQENMVGLQAYLANANDQDETPDGTTWTWCTMSIDFSPDNSNWFNEFTGPTDDPTFWDDYAYFNLYDDNGRLTWFGFFNDEQHAQSTT